MNLRKTFGKHSTVLLLYKRNMKMTNDNSIVNIGSFGNFFSKGGGKEGFDKIFRSYLERFL